MRTIRYLLLIGLITTSFLLPPRASSKSDSLEKTVDHLLQYVKESGCTFIRNNKEHDSRFAAEHIRKKYDYFKNKISTPEEFIKLCATKSLVSGKPYVVRCGENNKMSSADWLRAELHRYRVKIK